MLLVKTRTGLHGEPADPNGSQSDEPDPNGADRNAADPNGAALGIQTIKCSPAARPRSHFALNNIVELFALRLILRSEGDSWEMFSRSQK